MEIKLTKKLNASQKKEYIYENKTYDWECNYVKLIKENVDGEFSYDEDNKQCLIDGENFDDLMMNKLLKMFDKSGLNINNQNTIRKVMKNICREKPFSIKKEEKQRKKEEKERKNAEKDISKQANDFRTYINNTYGNRLSFNITKNEVYLDDKKMTYKEQDNIVMNYKIYEGNFFNLKKTEQYAIIKDVAEKHKFKESIKLNINNNIGFNILESIEGINKDNYNDYFVLDKNGKLAHTIHNYTIYLQYSPIYNGKIKRNLFSKNESILKYDKTHNTMTDVYIDDMEIGLIKSNIEKDFDNGNVHNGNFECALYNVLKHNEFNPVLDKLVDIRNKGWDGKHRMHEILIKYFGAIDCPENREMTEVMLCGALQRIVEEKQDEGVMFDYMGIMFGKQGTGKTKFMERLHLGDKLSSINPPIKDTQSFTDLTNRAWMVLFDEMTAIDKADMGEVKSRITEQGVNVRLSYGRRSCYYSRHNVFWGNTNYQSVLRDEGYERRFLCFECFKEEKETAEWWAKNYTDNDIEQIWAETWEIYLKKWEGKVIQISQKTEEFNYNIQKRHKVWVEDVRTELDIKRIIENDKFNKAIYLDDDFYEWESCLDKIFVAKHDNDKLPISYKHKLKYLPYKWLKSKIMRKGFWIDGILETMFSDWKLVEFVDGDVDFPSKQYLIRKDIDVNALRDEVKDTRYYRKNIKENERLEDDILSN